MKTTPINLRLRNWKLVSTATLVGLCAMTVGCGSTGAPIVVGGPGTPATAGPYTVTVNSNDPTSGVAISASPADSNAVGGGNSSFTLTYPANTKVTLTAPDTAPSPALTAEGPEFFDHWNGCITSLGSSCTINLQSDLTVTAVYKSQVTISLGASIGTALLVGTGQQIYLTITGNNVPDLSVIWTLAGPPGYTGDLGSINQSNGFYQSPYPAPAYVIITATSKFDPVATASITIQLGLPPASTGPALTVDTSAVTRPISPLIYGVNQLGDSESTLSSFVPTLDRWGGYTASRYNYLLDLTNTGSANNHYYETIANTNTAFPDTSAVNSQISLDQSGGIASVITMPMLGYVTQSPDATKRGFACAFSIAKYGAQTGADPNHPDCGNGDSAVNTNQYVNWLGTTSITIGSGTNAVTVTNGPAQITSPSDTSVAADQTFDAGWVSYLVGKYKNAASGGVAIYELDNEPEYWFYNHNDLHPSWTTFDDVTQRGIAYATAIKGADPTAAVGGPTVSGYYYYTESLADQYLGYYGKSNADKLSHNNEPFLQYYMEQMSAASATAGVRLLDYLDVHANQFTSGSGTTSGDTGVQEAREDSVRLFYDSSYSSNGNTYNLIPYLQGLVNSYYPGTKTAVTDYSFGGEESISGAIAQAEALAVFGSQGLDMAAMTSSQGPITDATYLPTQLAFDFFLNYDGAGSKFGDGSLATTSTLTGTDPVTGLPTTSSGTGQIAIYAAKRSSDGAITVLLFNKTYQTETASLALTTAATSAKVFQLSQGNLTGIASQPDAAVSSGTVSVTVPAQSITLLVFPE